MARGKVVRWSLRVLSALIISGFIFSGVSNPAGPGYGVAVAAGGGFSYAQLGERLQLLSNAYSELISLSVAGQSVEGRDIWAVTLGTGGENVLVTGALHGSEWITAPVLLETIEAYAQEYYQGKGVKGVSVQSFLDRYSITFFPMVNPDGVTLAQEGAGAFPHRQAELRAMNGSYGNDYSRWKANIRGVDLNRNFDVRWGEPVSENSAGSPRFAFYGGPAPETEPETQAITRWVRQNNPILLLDYHAYGEVLFWYYLQTGTALERDRKIAQAMRDYSGYRMEAVRPIQPGSTIRGWASMVLQIPSVVVEVGNRPPRLLTMQDLPVIFAQVKYLPLIAIHSLETAPVPVQGVSLPKKFEISLGEKAILEPVILPDNAANSRVQWRSSNPAIISVNSDGQLTALAVGEAEITATTNDGGYAATTRVIVSDRVLTAVERSRAGWESSDYVVLASSVSTGAASNRLAQKLVAPRLLTDADKLSLAAQEEILRLGAKKVYIYDEDGSIAERVRGELLRIQDLEAVKIYGYYASPALKSESAIIIYGFSIADTLALAGQSSPSGFALIEVREEDLYTSALHALKEMEVKKKVLISRVGDAGLHIFPRVVRIDGPGGAPDHHTAGKIFIAASIDSQENKGILLSIP